MSGATIGLLSASAETPGMPPCVGFEKAFTGEGARPAEGDFGPTNSSETEARKTDLAGVAEIGGRAAEDSKPAADQAAILADAPGAAKRS